LAINAFFSTPNSLQKIILLSEILNFYLLLVRFTVSCDDIWISFFAFSNDKWEIWVLSFQARVVFSNEVPILEIEKIKFMKHNNISFDKLFEIAS